MTRMHVHFVTKGPDAGDVGVKIAGSQYGILVDVAMAYETAPEKEPFDAEMTYLDSVVIGVLNGGYYEVVAFNEHGEWVERGWGLDDYFGGHGSKGYNTELPADRKTIVRRERRKFPGWPELGVSQR